MMGLFGRPRAPLPRRDQACEQPNQPTSIRNPRVSGAHANLPSAKTVAQSRPMELEDKQRFCRVVGQLLLADAEITDEEHGFLEKLMDRLGLDEAQKEAVVDSIDPSESTASLVQSLPESARTQLIVELEAAAQVDGEIADHERELIDAVRQALR